jgi:hypothetical protein
MENIDLSTFINWQTPVLCLGVYILVFVVRHVVDTLLKIGGHPNNLVWREMILPIMPVLMGVAIVLVMPMFPYPKPFDSSTGSLIIYGMICGFFSSVVYRIFKAAIAKKWPSVAGHLPEATKTAPPKTK